MVVIDYSKLYKRIAQVVSMPQALEERTKYKEYITQQFLQEVRIGDFVELLVDGAFFRRNDGKNQERARLHEPLR